MWSSKTMVDSECLNSLKQILPVSQIGAQSAIFRFSRRPFYDCNQTLFLRVSFEMLRYCWVPVCGKSPSAAQITYNTQMVTGQPSRPLSVLINKQHKKRMDGVNENRLWLNPLKQCLCLLFIQMISQGSHRAKGYGLGTTRRPLQRVLSALK